MLTDDELRYILGREMGRIKLGHTRLDLLLGSHRIPLPAALSIVTQLRGLVFASLDRAQAFSADRIGVVACGRIDHAVSTYAKLALGPRGATNFRLEMLEGQARQLAEGSTGLTGKLLLWQMAEAPLVYRLRELIAWAGLPDPPAPKPTAASPAQPPAAQPPKPAAPPQATSVAKAPDEPRPEAVPAGSDALPGSPISIVVSAPEQGAQPPAPSPPSAG
jgi:hypothetical protein